MHREKQLDLLQPQVSLHDRVLMSQAHSFDKSSLAENIFKIKASVRDKRAECQRPFSARRARSNKGDEVDTFDTGSVLQFHHGHGPHLARRGVFTPLCAF